MKQEKNNGRYFYIVFLFLLAQILERERGGSGRWGVFVGKRRRVPRVWGWTSIYSLESTGV